MIELPEAVRLAGQVGDELNGREIESGNCGNSAHKFAFYSRSQDDYAKLLPGKRVGRTAAAGSLARINIDPGMALLLGDGGLRVLLHAPASQLPAKYQMLLRFEDGSALTVSVQGWGFMHLVTQEEARERFSAYGLSPLDSEFTYQRFKAALEAYERLEQDSVKKFLISGGVVSGVGNGYLHDILFRAGIHPRRKMAEVTGHERRRLFSAIRKTIGDATERGGRDTEQGLHGEPGGYRPILDSRAKGQPCPQCGMPIEKVQYLGGACYFCPACQA
jgi:formamidopyrimidine-DNA glycosylase